MNKICPDFSTHCRFCAEEIETFVHFLTQCPALQAEILNIFSTYRVELEQLPEICPSQILEFAKEPKIAKALSQWEEEINGEKEQSL
jgi:hypothetical protein